MKLTGKSNTNSNPIPIADTVFKKCGEIGFFSGQKCNSPIVAIHPQPKIQNLDPKTQPQVWNIKLQG